MNDVVAETRLDVSADLHALRGKWGWFVALGVAMLLLGAAAMGHSFLVTQAAVIFLGWLLAIGGAIVTVQAFWQERGWSGFFLDLLVGLLYLATGLLIVANPAKVGAVLTLFIALMLLFSGVFRCVAAISYRFPNWWLLLLHGFLGILLGVMLVSSWPFSGLVFIGFCLGLEMAMNGVTAIAFGFALRGLPDELQPAEAA